jgi:hypothetical protein
MAKFYFDYVTPDGTAADDTGTDLPDFDVAKEEAIAAAGEWIKDRSAVGQEADLQIVVRSGKGDPPLLTVKASIKAS